MKRIPPSVRMKEEVEQLLRGDAVDGAAAQTPMRGFVRAVARYMLQVSIGATEEHFRPKLVERLGTRRRKSNISTLLGQVGRRLRI